MKTKDIYVYSLSSGEEAFRIDLENKKRPIQFSKKFKALRNAGYKILKVPVEEKKAETKDK